MDSASGAAYATGMILGQVFTGAPLGGTSLATPMGPRPATSAPSVQQMGGSQPHLYGSMPAKQTPIPTCPMLYAVITDAAVLARQSSGGDEMEPGGLPPLPALLPLQLAGLSLTVDCHISTGFVTIQGLWRMSAVRPDRRCDCLLALPMHNQGTVTAVEVDLGGGRMYATCVIPQDEASKYGPSASAEAAVDDTTKYNPELFRLTIPQVNGGTQLALKITYFQPMIFSQSTGLYALRVPLTFPEAVVSRATDDLSQLLSVTCNINTGASTSVETGPFNHEMKCSRSEPGRATFRMDRGSGKWKNNDFVASYKVWSAGISSSLIVQQPEMGTADPRGTFCLSISPPDPSKVQPFQRAVVFLLDRSGSMTGMPMTSAKGALEQGLNMLLPEDLMAVIAFNHEQFQFSPQLLPATPENVGAAKEWLSTISAYGGTDILQPLNTAVGLLAGLQGAVPSVFLITDGAVKNERDICKTMQGVIARLGPNAPRITTFGIGHWCNFYFLKMLASIGRGLTDIVFKPERIRDKMERLLIAASTPLLTYIRLNIPELPRGCEVYPDPIPDLFCGMPLVVSGKFEGSFPASISVVGLLPGGVEWSLRVHAAAAPGIPLAKVFAKQQLDLLVAQGWLAGPQDLRLRRAAVALSVATGVPCEHTRLVAFETTPAKYQKLQQDASAGKRTNLKPYLVAGAGVAVIGGLAIGFGSIAATVGNLPLLDALPGVGFDVGGGGGISLGGISLDGLDCSNCDCGGCDGCDDCCGIGELLGCCCECLGGLASGC